MVVSFVKQRKVGSRRVENNETKVESSTRLPCVILQRCKCVDIHRSGERASSGPAKGATEQAPPSVAPFARRHCIIKLVEPTREVFIAMHG